MTLGWLLLAALAADPQPVSSIAAARLSSQEGRTTLLLILQGEPTRIDVRREGGEVVLTTAAVAPQTLVLPEPSGVVASLRLDRGPPTTLRVGVAEDVPFETRLEGQFAMVHFGQAAALPEQASQPASVSDLYALVFPPAAEEAESGGQVVQPGEEGEPGADEDKRGGYGFGPLRLRPGITGSLVKSRVSVTDSPEPVTDTFYEVQPVLRTELAVQKGGLKLSYQPRFRFFSSFEKIREPSHLVDGSLLYPTAGPTLRLTHRFALGVLETNEVDPGREYFFDLTRFQRNDTHAGLRWETGGGLAVDAQVDRNRVSFEERSAFFSYEQRGFALAAELATSGDRKLVATASGANVVETPERPQAEGSQRRYTLGVRGEILPLTSGEASAGLETRSAPRAGEGGKSYHGLALRVGLTRELSRSSRMTLGADRTTLLSGFDENGFYVSSLYRAEYHRTLPYEVTAHAGVSYRKNTYPVPSASVGGEGRRDRLLSYSAGFGRALTRWFYGRVDYVRERRRSNAPFANLTTGTLLFQLGLGLLQAR